LPGITRDAVTKLAEDLNIPVKESVIPREMLYIADEVFFVGTAVEITPIRSVDHIKSAKGVAGPNHPQTAGRILRRHQREASPIATTGSRR